MPKRSSKSILPACIILCASSFEDYGLGAFLLAGSEVYRLADH